MRMSYKIRLRVSYSFCILLLGLFSVTRVYRNSIGYSNTNVGGIWNVVTLIFMALCFVVLFKVGKFPGTIKVALIYSLIAFFNALINIKSISLSSVYNLIMIGYFSMILCSFFAATKTGITSKDNKLTLVVFVSVSIMVFVGLFRFRAGVLSFVMVSNAYYSLCLMPFLPLFTKKKWIIVSGYTLVGVIIIFSSKRLGLIAYLAYLLVVIFYDSIKHKRAFSLLKVFLIIMISIVVFATVYTKLQSKYELNIIERTLNLSKDGGSGRDDMYREILQGMNESSLFEWIIGHGYGTTGTVMLKHDTAHNDFLEILFDFGLFPTLFFVAFYIGLLVDSLKMFRERYEYAGVFIGSVVISLLLSMFSTYCVSYAYVTCGMASIGAIYGMKSASDYIKIDGVQK